LTVDVVTVGETMAVFRGPGPLRLGGRLDLSIAGAESNVAIGLARLGHSVRWVGRVGDDELGQLVERTLRAENVDTSAVVTDPERPTGLMLREQRIGHTARVSYYRAGSAGRGIEMADVLPSLPGARILHLTGITTALGSPAAEAVAEAARAAHAAGTTVCFDVNHRSRLWSAEDARTGLRPLLGDVDILVASEDELPILADDVRDLPVPLVVVTSGAAGARAHSAGDVVEIPALPVPVVDLVGAGDAFVAGLLSATLDGLPLEQRLGRAVMVAAFAVAHDGDWEGLPTRAELTLLDGGPEATVR
jgi:2-dehydro-3-deoxygluconokinase